MAAVLEQDITMRDVHRVIKEKEIRFIDLKFADILGGYSIQRFPLKYLMKIYS